MSEQFERELARIRSIFTVGAVLNHKLKRSAKPEKKKWRGNWPASCDFCHDDLQTTELFMDGRTRMGPWALMCPECHNLHGVGVGPGKAQAYDSDTREKFVG